LLRQLAELRPVFERDGVVHLMLFGSRARKDHRLDSDVDLLIDIDRSRKFSLLDLVGVGHIIEDNIGLPASVVIRDDADGEFIHRVLQDAIPVF